MSQLRNLFSRRNAVFCVTIFNTFVIFSRCAGPGQKKKNKNKNRLKKVVIFKRIKSTYRDRRQKDKITYLSVEVSSTIKL